MGLAIYAFTTQRDIPAVDFSHQDDAVQIFAWRSHWKLAIWLERLYRAKGSSRDFNGSHLRIDGVDLDALEKAIRASEIPADYPRYITLDDNAEPAEDNLFIRTARNAIAKGLSVYLACCW